MEVLLGGFLAIVGGVIGAAYQAKLARDAETRAEHRRQLDRLRESRLADLRAAFRLQITMAEHVRAVQAGELPEQIARLRQQMESGANVDADPTLLDPEAVMELANIYLGLLEREPGSGVTRNELQGLAAVEAKLQVSYRAAKHRLLSE